ncbi:MAG TPA: clostripain-related cysteine peptidase [bacterium]|nr:clostripain-related cysteine peptidase [bacterium]
MKKLLVFISMFSVLLSASCDNDKKTSISDTDNNQSVTDQNSTGDDDSVENTDSATDTETPDAYTADTDPCNPNPCTDAHKTVCTLNGDSYTCSCDNGFVLNGTACIDPSTMTGKSCDLAIPLTGSGSVSGTTASSSATYTYEVTDDCTDGCEATAKENIYSFTVETNAYFSFSMAGENAYDTLVYLRSDCEVVSSQLFCNDDSNGSGSAGAISGKVSPGTYYFFADGCTGSGSYTLDYSINTDPCIPNPCEDKDCSASEDFSLYECTCPSGTIESNGNCVDDPCDPNPCTVTHKTKCTATTDASSYNCACDSGYTDQSGTCVEDDKPAWTIMVFMNADNNLDSDGGNDLTEMKSVTSSDNVNILVLADRTNTTAKLYKIGKGTATQVKDFGELNMSSGTSLESFGKYVAENYPAQHNMLILWDHGLDWRKAAMRTKGFSDDFNGSDQYDDDEDEISIASGEYASALSGITTVMGKKFDIIGFDACLMGSWELAAATQPYADYLVASEETEPNGGWAYNVWMPIIVKNPNDVTPVEIGKKIADSYYDEGDYFATMAVFDLSKVQAFGTALSAFATDLSSSSKNSIENIRSNLGNLGDSGYGDYIDDARDIYEFTNNIKSSVGTSATNLLTAYENLVIYLRTKNTSGWNVDYTNMGGMSIYFPKSNSGYDSAYEDSGAKWNNFTTWNDFVSDYAGN